MPKISIRVVCVNGKNPCFFRVSTVSHPMMRLFALFTDDGISIPCEYTSYLAPISAPKLHFEVSQSNDTSKGTLVTMFIVCCERAESAPFSVLPFHKN